MVAADRGLAGGYNTTVIRAPSARSRPTRRGHDYVLITVGRKAESYFRFRNYRIDRTFPGSPTSPTTRTPPPSARPVRPLRSGEVQAVELVFTAFVSIGPRRSVVAVHAPRRRARRRRRRPRRRTARRLEFEPVARRDPRALLPRYVEARLFAALLDAAASEHATRQRAMKAATDNAEELMTSLSRIMNRARQDTITTEIMEIVGGAEALGADKGGNEDLMPDLPRSRTPSLRPRTPSTTRPCTDLADRHRSHTSTQHR